MKKYIKEIIALALQLLIFYLLPLFMDAYNPAGMVLLMLLLTFILSIIIGVIINNKFKFIYPMIIALLFIPTVFIYYNESALIHSIWYLVVSYIGIGLGILIKRLI